jgi:hypothetical protein
MRTLALAVALLATASIAATAEPPPQSDPPAVASASAQTVADVQFAAVLVTQPDTVDTSARSTATVDTARPLEADRDGGHGMGFWIGVAILAVLVIAFGVMYLLKRPSPQTISSSEQPPEDRGRPPGSSGRGSGKY